MKWLCWPVSLSGVSRIGRYLPYGVAVLARIGGRHEPRWPLLAYGVAALARIGGRREPYWPLFAVRRGGSGPRRWPL